MSIEKLPAAGTASPLHSVRSAVHVDDLHITSVLSNRGITINADHELTEDEAMILALGYKQEFKREFSLLSIFAVSFSVLGLLPSVASCFSYQQLVVGMSPIPWLIAVLFITSVAYSMAEVALAFPTLAGTPYAVSQLAPKRYAAFFTWVTCFSNWICQITASPLVNYAGACMILALKAYNSTLGYLPSNGEIYGLTLGIQVVHAIISLFPTRWLAYFNTMSTGCNMLFLAIVFVMILAGNKRDEINPGATKFNKNGTAWGLYNQTDWPMGIAMLQLFLGVIWAMSGYDSPFHLSEECSNAAVAAPKAIVLTATAGGTIGFLFMLAIAYTMYDIDAIAADEAGLGQPFVSFLSQILDKKLVNAATALTIISSFFMGCLCMLAASRVTYAYLRDGLFPGSRWWKKVNPITQTPINAVWINCLLGQLLLLLMFAGDVAIGAIFSVGGIAGFVSFTMPTLFKITCLRNFQRGPWHLGRWLTPIGVVLCAFVLVMIPILCFPYVRGKHLNPEEMNWTSTVYFGSMLLFIVWFLVDAHRWYEGPKCNIDPGSITYDDIGVIDGIHDGEKTSYNINSKESV